MHVINDHKEMIESTNSNESPKVNSLVGGYNCDDTDVYRKWALR